MHVESGHTTYLGCGSHHAKRAEGVVKQPLVHILVKVANEEVCAYVELFFVRRCLYAPKEGS